MNPSSRISSILNKYECFWNELVEILEYLSCQNFELELWTKYNFMTADEAKIGYSDLLRIWFLNDWHSSNAIIMFILRKVTFDLLKEDMVDQVNKFHMSREQFGEHINWPFLHLTFFYGVESAAKCSVSCIPSIKPR